MKVTIRGTAIVVVAAAVVINLNLNTRRDSIIRILPKCNRDFRLMDFMQMGFRGRQDLIKVNMGKR